MKFSGIAASLVIAASVAAPHSARAQSASAGPAASCAPAGDLHFVCGLTNVEDFLPVEGGRWLVGGSYKPGSVGLYLIDTATKTAIPVSLSITAKTDPIYHCAAPDLKGLSTHGLDVTPARGGITTVYAVNHGGRESIEVFKLNAAKASAQWVGCVVLPPGANGNSVTILSNGAFAVTKFLDNNDKQAFQHILAGQINGVVYLWTRERASARCPGPSYREITVSSPPATASGYTSTPTVPGKSIACPCRVKASDRVSRSISTRTICAGHPMARFS